MDAKEIKTFNAAMRLLKSKLRYDIYEQRQNEANSFLQMLALEKAILTEARDGWAAVRDEWDLSDDASRAKVDALVQEALDRSLRAVSAMLSDLTGQPSLEVLQACVQTPGWLDLLPDKGVPCRPVTS